MNAYPEISIEIIPRRSIEGLKEIEKFVPLALSLRPRYFDLVFVAASGADVNGNGRDASWKTLDLLGRLAPEIPVAPHLTTTGLDIKNTVKFVEELSEIGVRRFVLLGGDPPRGRAARFDPKACFKSTEALITKVCDIYKGLGLERELKIIVGVEPERADALTRLKSKITAGIISEPGARRPISAVEEAITQYCNIPGLIPAFLRKAENAGIKIPVIPGVRLASGMPETMCLLDRAGNIVLDASGNRIAVDVFGVRTPNRYVHRFSGLDRGEAAIAWVNQTIAIEVIQEIANVDKLHLYPHNKGGLLKIFEKMFPGIASAPAQAGAPQRRLQPGRAVIA